MTQSKRPLTLEDFWSLKTVSDVQLSPDGKTIAYVVGSYDEKTNTAHSAIWLTDLESGRSRQFTSGEASDSQPRWSRDGSRLAFVSTRHEGKPQVFIIDRDGGEPRRLTNAKDGAHSPLWSPDGTQLCFSSALESDRQKVPQEEEWFAAHPDADHNMPHMRRQNTLMSRFDGRGYIDRRTHLFVIDVDTPGAEPRQLTDGDYDDLEPTWSPDGALIAFLSNRTADAEHNFATDVWTVALDSGEMKCLTNGDLTAYAPSWSPDGTTIAVYAMPEWVANGWHDTHVWTVSRQGGEQRDLLAEHDQAARSLQPDYMWPLPTPPVWSPDGQTIYYLAQDRGDSAIYALSLATGSVRRVSKGHADIASIQCTPDGQLLVCLAATPTHPYDVFAVRATGGELTAVTETNRELLEAVTLVPPERMVFKGASEWDIEGWLIKPVNAVRTHPYPLILHVHGGPFGAWGHTFYFQAQVLAGAGYASLYINPRGSTGYGEAFSQARDWGEKDYEDLMAGVDAVLATGEVDPQRLGITGISYGGFMTNWVIGHTDRFAAAVSCNGVSNFFSMYGVSDVTALWFEQEFGGPFWRSEEHWQRYRYHSPITYVDAISTPLLLLQSENDYRCPIEQGEQMLTALRMRRQVVELIRIPGASHVLVASGMPHQRYLQWRLTRDWFDIYIKGEGQAQIEQEAGVTAEGVPVP